LEHLQTQGGVGTLVSPLLSPFSSAGASLCPLARVSNFQVWVAGQAWFMQPINYGAEMYFAEVRKKAVYGGSWRGITSGLSPTDWELNYPYVYVDLNRWPDEASDNALKSIQLQFTNASACTMDYYVFMMYEREITLSIPSGQLII